MSVALGQVVAKMLVLNIKKPIVKATTATHRVRLLLQCARPEDETVAVSNIAKSQELGDN
jgi:hypothetical protein